MLTLTLPESVKAPHYYSAYGVPDWRQAIFFAFSFFLFWQDHRISEWVNGYRGDQTCDHVHVHGHDQCRCSASRQQARPSKSHQILEARIRNAILLGCPRYLMSRLTARCTIFTSGKT